MSKTSQKLIDCLKCGRKISIRADKCPKCGFEPSHCLICGERITPRSLLKKSYNKYTRYHRECIKKLFTYPVGLSCKTCGSQFLSMWLDSLFPFERTADSDLPYENFRFATCPNCGEKNPIEENGDCKQCHLTILGFQDYCTPINSAEKYHAICRPDIIKKNKADKERKEKYDHREERNGSLVGGVASLIKGILVVLAVLLAVMFAGQILMAMGSYLNGLPHAADGFFEVLLLIPVSLIGLVIWLVGFMMSIPLFLIENVTGLCLAFGPGTVLSSSMQAGTISFCK
jgi:ribosomal protein L40E